MDSDVGCSDGEYANHAKSSADANLLVDDTDAAEDVYDTRGLIAQLSADTEDSEELMGDVRNLIDRNVRNFDFALHHKA